MTSLTGLTGKRRERDKVPKKPPMEEKPEIKLESKIDRQIKGRPGLGSALLGWVLGRWGWQAGRLGWAGGAGRARRQAGRLVRAGWGSQGRVLGRWQSWQGRLAWLGRLAGLAESAGAAGARLGFAGLGPMQVAVRAGQWGRQVQPGLSSALLGWVLGRLQSGVGWQAGAAGAWLGFAGLGPRQVAGRVGQWGRQVQRGLSSALLGWVLGRWQSGQGRWGMQGQPGLVRMGRLGRWGRSQRHISSRRIKDSTLNTGPILALLDDTALPGAKAEGLESGEVKWDCEFGMCWGTEDDNVESDGYCDDDDQIRPVQLLLRPAPYDEGSGHWARTNNGGAADRLWEEIDQTLSVPEKLMLSGLKNEGDRGGRYIRKRYHRQDLDDGREREGRQGWKDWPRGFSDGAGSYPWLESGPRLRTGGAESDAAVDVVTVAKLLLIFERTGVSSSGLEADEMTGGQEPVMRMKVRRELAGRGAMMGPVGCDGEDSALWRAAGSWAGWAVKGRWGMQGQPGLSLAWLGWVLARARLGFARLVCGQVGRQGGQGRHALGLAFLIDHESFSKSSYFLWRKSPLGNCTFMWRNLISQEEIITTNEEVNFQPLGSLLADDMGLGKTLQSIALIFSTLPSLQQYKDEDFINISS
ncbi:hypothetical protein BY996DRAFT_6490868 [Phakopsora pachyrhizi]|nr:hypothetical protein BY996DRAFT_6490868 [Phakopsora pachyrhizi]